ncbi:nucleotidyltransferase substrate binding protein [Desulfobotulus sp.]|jgi:hypothetical protein|uniref:nucleotidyltransferase substrate binding protein n=1 Tax=Desulfobotulus sp. TaxID=1940337 RepID=UPI002A3643CF|nr:nucleotidyltransferase substrate binding protein [Desulfobotulus sp.]MDY0163534.1 nucleotidyltransferase substrate binding protein [Desulfobotulus sp.]
MTAEDSGTKGNFDFLKNHGPIFSELALPAEEAFASDPNSTFYQGNSAIRGSRDAIREAFKYGLIEDGESWMETIQTRNQTPHAYPPHGRGSGGNGSGQLLRPFQGL